MSAVNPPPAPSTRSPAASAAAPDSSLSQRLANGRRTAGTYWAGLAARERIGLAVAAAVLGLALLWAVALGPALATLRTAPLERERLDAQFQEMQALAAEAKSLRGAAPVSPDQGRAALEAAVGRLGGRVTLSLQGPRAVLALKGLTGNELAALLNESRTGARARVTEATLNQAAPGRFDGQLILALGGRAP